jgi:hypothetical protein
MIILALLLLLIITSIILSIYYILNPKKKHSGKTKLLMGQSSIFPLQDYIDNIDSSGKSLWGGSVYWFLQSNTFKHNLVGADGECCYPNTCSSCGNGCQSNIFPQNGMLLESSFFRSNPENCNDLYGYSTTNTLNKNTQKYGKYLLVALNLKEECFNETSEDCLNKCVKTGTCTSEQEETMNERRLNYLDLISSGKFDKNLDQCKNIIEKNSNIHFLFRIGYEIQLSYFVTNQEDYLSWNKARTSWNKAYIHIANYLKSGSNNVSCVLHVGQEVLFSNNDKHKSIIQGLHLKNGYQFTQHSDDKLYTTVELMMNNSVDIIGFSVFSGAFSNSQDKNCQLQCTNNNKSCDTCNVQINSQPCVDIIKWYNNDYSPIRDSSLRANMYVAKTYYNKSLMICESGMLSPWQCNENNSINFLNGIINILTTYNIIFWSFIGGNSWKKTGWQASDGWPQVPFWHFPKVKKYFLDTVLKYLEKK